MIGRKQKMPPVNKNFVSVVLDNSQTFLAALEELTKNAVFVGIPSTRITREPSPGEPNPPNNAVIGYVQENGDPAHNVPPRPFLMPAIRENQAEIVKRLRAIATAGFSGNLPGVKNLRTQLGLYAQRAVQQKITDGPFAPLSEATLQARARRKFGRGAAGARRGAGLELARRAAGLAPGTDFARPLIDTGQLRRAITYVIGPARNVKKSVKAMTGTWPVFTSK